MQNKSVYSEHPGENHIAKVGLQQMSEERELKQGSCGAEDGDQVVPSIVRNVKWNRKEMREGRG